MQQALAYPQAGADAYSGQSSPWAMLPGLCCQAAGGDPHWTDDLTSAWLFYYRAAHIMDSIEDQDAPQAWWADWGSGVAINVASGLFFSAAQVLDLLHQRPETRPAASEVIAAFYLGFLNMCGGQHLDLTLPMPTLEQYWQMAAAKSGHFFELACWSGARLAVDDSPTLDSYRRFGLSLGLLVQIRDDLEEIKMLHQGVSAVSFARFNRSLPLVYALTVLPKPQREALLERMKTAALDATQAGELLDLVDQSGAALYLQTQLERHRGQAMEALGQAAARPPASEKLSAFLNRLEA